MKDESCLQMVTAEQREYEGVFVCRRIEKDNKQK